MDYNDDSGWRELLLATILALVFAILIWVVIIVDYFTIDG